MGKIDVSRYIDVAELKFEVEFITPAFLGGADSNAEIRTAPFKNLIRRWWRIANGNLSPEKLWIKENELFGSTEKNPKIVEANKTKKKPEREAEIFGKSKVGLFIDDASEVKVSADAEKGNLKKFLYLGYGPVQNNVSDIKNFLKAGSKFSLTLTVPKEEKNNFINILTLINLFGEIGSRSRKSFGSVQIIPATDNFKLNNLKTLREQIPYLVQNCTDAMNSGKNYPHCIGRDEKGLLCWNTQDRESYAEVLADLTEIYKGAVQKAKSASADGRTILGSADKIPKTDIERIPSSLLLKVIKSGEKYKGRILHLPYNINSLLKGQNKVWNEIYSYFDEFGLKRFGGAAK